MKGPSYLIGLLVGVVLSHWWFLYPDLYIAVKVIGSLIAVIAAAIVIDESS